jgi:ketosteroid isomerase-like protein
MTTSRPAGPAEVISALATALHDGRIDDALALYEPEATFVPQPHATPITGHAAIAAALTQFAALHPHLSSTIRSVVTAGDVATVINDWQLEGTAPDGSTVHMAATSADVMRRRSDSSWGILIDNPWALST